VTALLIPPISSRAAAPPRMILVRLLTVVPLLVQGRLVPSLPSTSMGAL
jgi:hypothetical protein